MKALPLADYLDLLRPEKRIHIFTPAGSSEEKEITSIRRHNRFIILSFADVKDPETASRYRGSTVNILRKEYPELKNGEFFYDQIIGLSVYTEDGEKIGKITDILNTGSNDVYIVEKNKKEHLIPAIKDVIRDIDIKKGRIIITVINGLLD
jgi:16S rRNA processing protein RimM